MPGSRGGEADHTVGAVAETTQRRAVGAHIELSGDPVEDRSQVVGALVPDIASGAGELRSDDDEGIANSPLELG